MATIDVTSVIITSLVKLKLDGKTFYDRPLTFSSDIVTDYSIGVREIVKNAVDEEIPFGGITKGKILLVINKNPEAGDLRVKVNDATTPDMELLVRNHVLLDTSVDIAKLFVTNPSAVADIQVEFTLIEEA